MHAARLFYLWVDSWKIKNLSLGFLKVASVTTEHGFSPDVSLFLHTTDHVRRFITQQTLILFPIAL